MTPAQVASPAAPLWAALWQPFLSAAAPQPRSPGGGAEARRKGAAPRPRSPSAAGEGPRAGRPGGRGSVSPTVASLRLLRASPSAAGRSAAPATGDAKARRGGRLAAAPHAARPAPPRPCPPLVLVHRIPMTFVLAAPGRRQQQPPGSAARDAPRAPLRFRFPVSPPGGQAPRARSRMGPERGSLPWQNMPRNW